MAYRIPNENKNVERLRNELSDVSLYMVTYFGEDYVSVFHDEHYQTAAENIGDMCLKSTYKRLYYFDDGEVRYYFTADNDDHALERLGLQTVV